MDENIYLCNGLNGTPDKRGRVPVGAIQLVPGGTPDPAVNPASDPLFNYDYAVGNIYGANSITLSSTQIPAHTHTTVSTSTCHFISWLNQHVVRNSPKWFEDSAGNMRN